MAEDQPKKRPAKRTRAAKGGSAQEKAEKAETIDNVPAVRKVTLFGGSGFIGRRVVRALHDGGAHVRVAARHPGPSNTSGAQAGKDHPDEVVEADVTDFESVGRAVGGADAVINLVGILYEKGSQTFEKIHEEGARNVARAASAAGVGSLIHMSALGASTESPSKYARSKAMGEQAVREAFPSATVIRPSIVFGPEDDFFNMFAGMARFSPALPLIGGGATKFQPVYVDDVGRAFAAILADPDHQDKTYELAGPKTYSFKELLRLTLDTMGARRFLVPVPFFVAQLEGAVLEYLPKPPLTRDQVELLKTDNVASGEHPGLADLGIEPTALEGVLPSYIG